MTVTNRHIFLGTALTCGVLLAFGYYLQYGQGHEPCPMCIFQRWAYMAIGLISLIAGLVNPKRLCAWGFSLSIAFFGLAGAAIAARQTWLQHLPPDKVPECGPGLEMMMQIYPLLDVFRKALTASGECAVVTWRFLGLSIAEWSLGWFTLIVAAAFWITARRLTRQP